MDATHRPFQIPPEFGVYSEKHALFDLFKELLEKLIIHRPQDPLTFLIDELGKENENAPKVIVLGPPAAGKATIGRMLGGRLRCPHLTKNSIISGAKREIKQAIEAKLQSKQAIPTELWIAALSERLSQFDCDRKGWVLSGFPQTRQQAIALQQQGIIPQHVVLLQAPDSVLIERAQGKRIDPETGDVYHLNFDPPPLDGVAERLVEEEGNSEENMMARMLEYHRLEDGLITCYESIIKNVNADQPIADIFSTTLDFVSRKARSVAPRNPRIILLGPPGSGKSSQATLLSNKYQFVNVDCGQLIRQHIEDQTKSGLAMRSYVQGHKPVPDALLLQVLKQRLTQLDCVSRGWILHGYPRNRSQAEQLTSSGLSAERVFVLDVPSYTAINRLTGRRLDHVTGERYHEEHKPATESKVQARLLSHPLDSQNEVEARLQRYCGTQEELLDYYTIHQVIPADQDIHAVFELLESHIVNPIPKKFD